MFLIKTVWGARGATRGANVEFPEISSPMWTLFASHSLKISCFLHEIELFSHCLFKTLCLLCFEQTLRGPSKTEGAENQQRIGPGPALGWIWESFGGPVW